MGVTLSRSLNAKEPTNVAPDKTGASILPAKGRLIDELEAQRTAAAPAEPSRRRLPDAGYE